MGGSGGNDYSPGLGRGPEVDCARLRFTAHPTSLSADVLSTVAAGDTTDVLLVDGPSFQAIEIWTRSDGAVLGAVVERWAELQHCLLTGMRFVADLVTVTSPVTVNVHPRGAAACSTLSARTRLHMSSGEPIPLVGSDLPLSLDVNYRQGEQARVQDAMTGRDVGWVRCHPVDLSDCLAAGHLFHAVVEAVDGELVTVQVEPRPEIQ